MTERQVLPWLLSGYALGDHVLELGSGPGATTPSLRRRTEWVTSLEYDARYAAKLAARGVGPKGTVLCGDAATLPFPDRTFSSAVSVGIR